MRRSATGADRTTTEHRCHAGEAQRPKVLVVLHQESSSAGRVGHVLLESGFDLDIRRPPLGDRCPTRWRAMPAPWCSAGR